MSTINRQTGNIELLQMLEDVELSLTQMNEKNELYFNSYLISLLIYLIDNFDLNYFIYILNIFIY